MLPFLIGTTPVAVPTSWADVTVARWLAWQEALLLTPDGLAPVAGLLGCDVALLDRVYIADADRLLAPLAFLSEPMPDAPIWSYPANVGNEAYLAVEEARLALRAALVSARADHEDEATAWAVGRLRALPGVWGRLTQRHNRRSRAQPGGAYDQAGARARADLAATRPADEVIPAALALLADLLAFFDRHRALFEPDDDDETARAEAAGADRFTRYGHLLPVATLCDNDPTRYAEVYQLPAQQVYLALSIRRDNAAFAAAYRQVLADEAPA